MLVLSGSSGWRTCSSLLSIRLNNDSSAAVNKSVIVGTSSAQYPYRLLRLKNASSRARSLAEQRPDYAGAQ